MNMLFVSLLIMGGVAFGYGMSNRFCSLKSFRSKVCGFGLMLVGGVAGGGLAYAAGLFVPAGGFTSEHIRDLTSMEEFDQALAASDQPVVVDYYTNTCSVCMRLAPVVSELAEEWHGKVRFAKVNANAVRDLAGREGIEGVPTLIFYVNGKEVPGTRRMGYVPKDQLAGILHRITAHATTSPEQ